MATIEKNGLMASKNKNGDLEILYPITRIENIENLEIATHQSSGLMSAEDKRKIDEMPSIAVPIEGTLLKKDNVGWYFEI